jgi:hypothetical protein
VDKIINAHVDKLEELERQIDVIIEQETSQIEIDTLISNPQAVLAQVAENIKRIFLDEYVDKAVELGFELGRIIKNKIEQDKTIKVDDSKDPNLND